MEVEKILLNKHNHILHMWAFYQMKIKLYVVCLGLDQVCFFDVGEDGTLTLDNVHTLQLEPGCGPKKNDF